MKQLRMHGVNDLRLDDVEVPKVGPGDALIKVIAAGICGSDLNFLRQGYIGLPNTTPSPLGHELVGTVHALGAQVKDLKAGQRVVIHPMKGRNRIGTGDSLHGGFAEYVLVRDAAVGESIFPIAEHLTYERAVLAEPIAVGMHGLNKANAQSEDRVVVLGAGPIGLGVVAALRHRGIQDIIVVDIVEERLARARELGASGTINTAHQDLQGTLVQLLGTRKSKIARQPCVNASLYIDCAGFAPLLSQVFAHCADNARILILATYKEPVPVDLAQLIIKEIALIGSLSYPTEFAEVLDMLSSPGTVIEPMISHSYPFEQFNEAFQTALDAKQSAKVILRFDQSA